MNTIYRIEESFYDMSFPGGVISQLLPDVYGSYEKALEIAKTLRQEPLIEDYYLEDGSIEEIEVSPWRILTQEIIF
jgi:hypothetical protein